MQAQVDAPAALVLLDGHALHDDAPAALYVLAPQTARAKRDARCAEHGQSVRRDRGRGTFSGNAIFFSRACGRHVLEHTRLLPTPAVE